MIEAYPLCWPVNRPRSKSRGSDAFGLSFARARDDIIHEVQLLGGKELIISSNVPLRRDGLPYADFKTPDDPGVAAYFDYKKRKMCFACDRYSRATANIQAIAKTINALRGISRWGTGDMMEAAFTGFVALPAPGQTTAAWRDTLNLDARENNLDVVKRNYQILRSANHPDRGGNAHLFDAVNRAWEQAQQELRP